MNPLSDDALDRLFRTARTYNSFLDRPVSDGMLREVYDLARMAPTSANSSPARFVFVRSKEAKAKLAPALSPGNHDKTMAAPVTAIVAYDTEFHEHLPAQFPAMPGARDMFHGNTPMIEVTGLRNSSLQGAYLILAARGLGLDCGPMSGFDAAKVDAAFFLDGRWRTNFLLNIGYGDRTRLHPRLPRLGFDEIARWE